MTQFVKVDPRFLTRILHTVSKVHRLSKRHRLYCMTPSFGTYSEEIVREFYASYVDTLRGSIDRRSKPVKQDALTSLLVRG